MKRALIFGFLGVCVVALACGGWAVQGVRWAVTRPRRRPVVAPRLAVTG